MKLQGKTVPSSTFSNYVIDKKSNKNIFIIDPSQN